MDTAKKPRAYGFRAASNTNSVSPTSNTGRLLAALAGSSVQRMSGWPITEMSGLVTPARAAGASRNSAATASTCLRMDRFSWGS